MEHFSRLGTDGEFDFLYERSTVREQPSVSESGSGPSTGGFEVVSGDTEGVDEVRWSEDSLEYRLFDGELSPATEVLEVDAADESVVYRTEGEPAVFGGDDVEAEVSGAFPYVNEVLEALNDYADTRSGGAAEGKVENYLEEVEGALQEGEEVTGSTGADDGASRCLDALRGAVSDIREEVKDDMY